ncbi:MAG: acyl-CoA dehydrogenase family protein, partial [Gemmatimonadota bacterium]|nr:acyl-CoA dehydrogenase family protein [Gemmatimonadota bacterium]
MSWALHDLSEEQSEIQKVAREFAATEIAPHSAEWDQKAYFEPSLVGKLGELGFLGMLLPEE